MIDILEGVNREVKIGEHGLVFLVDCMPRVIKPEQTMDHAILRAARTSYGNSEKEGTDAENRGLIRYLVRNAHTTPVEFCVFQFYLALPIFVARQLIRHRMQSVNEYSLRYSEPKEQCYVPPVDDVRQQSKTNKQGSEGQVDSDLAQYFREVTQETFDAAYKQYQGDTSNGIGREQARINLPLSTFTFWHFKMDLHNLLRTLSLRMDKHAQKEIRDYANAIYEIVKPLAPWTIEAFNDFDMRRDAMLLTGPEVNFLRDAERWAQNLGCVDPLHLNTRVTMREQEEFVVKLNRLGMTEQAGRLSDWIKSEKDRIKKEKDAAEAEEKKRLDALKPF